MKDSKYHDKPKLNSPGINRRTFLKTTALSGSALLLNPIQVLGDRFAAPSDYFGLNPFIENNPNAVFIMKTDVDVKTNSGACKQAGLDFANSVFVNLEESQGSYPITSKVAIKPNLTCRKSNDSRYTIEGTMGIVTDAYMVEGIIDHIKGLGLAGSQFYLREVNCPDDFTDSGYNEMASRTGADIRDLSARVDKLSEDDIQWIDVPDGTWFRKVPYLWPINAADTFLLNISKFKAHYMGLTLCAKNLQGSIAHNYQYHCATYAENMDLLSSEHQNPNAKKEIMDNYNRHVADGIPRWDRPGSLGGLWQETWATRCLDNNSVTHPNLHIIEGIYGRDGHFIDGPSPDGLATDYMTNIIVFGKNPFYVDIIGHWLGGHEPGNFGLFHMAMERGFSSALNPMDIPVYEWKADGSAMLTPLADFERTPLKSKYLQRDYDGQSEELFHLCDEAYDYTWTGIDLTGTSHRPESCVLLQNYPNPFNPSTSIEFSIPKSGFTRLEIINIRGEIVDVLFDQYCQKGKYQAVWKAGFFPSGNYFYRLRFNSFSEVKKLTLLK